MKLATTTVRTTTIALFHGIVGIVIVGTSSPLRRPGTPSSFVAPGGGGGTSISAGRVLTVGGDNTKGPTTTTTTSKGLALYYFILRERAGQGVKGHTANPQARPLKGRPAISVEPIFNMSANDDAGSKRKRLRLDDNAANFFYTGQENVPDGVIHVRVHPSIKVIRAKAFL